MSQKILGNEGRGHLFVVSAPAGTGKSTLVERLLEEFPDAVFQSRSCTTRKERLDEGTEYHYQFLTAEEFEKKVEAGEFLEYAQVFGDYYGTPKSEVETLLHRGHVVLIIDVQGAMQLQQKKIPATFIFISPPSMEELQERLTGRKTEDAEKIQERLDWAEKELKLTPHYDYHIVNDNLDVTYQILRGIFIAEENKTRG